MIISKKNVYFTLLLYQVYNLKIFVFLIIFENRIVIQKKKNVYHKYYKKKSYLIIILQIDNLVLNYKRYRYFYKISS